MTEWNHCRTTDTACGISDPQTEKHVGNEMDDIEPALLTSAQAAKLAGVGKRTWWRWTNSGLAPRPLKIGRGPRAAVRFRREDIVSWIDGGCPDLRSRAS